MILERFKVPEKDQVLVSEAALGRRPPASSRSWG